MIFSLEIIVDIAYIIDIFVPTLVPTLAFGQPTYISSVLTS